MQRSFFSRNIFIVVILFFISSCAYKKNSFLNKQKSKNSNVSVFIHMPDNFLVFENLSYIAYKAVVNHFRNVGYKVVDSDINSYILKIEIKKLDPLDKIISPDLLLYGSRMELKLLCSAFDKKGKLIKKKRFDFSTLICISKDSKLHSSFLDFEFSKLIKNRAAPNIEQYFRSMWR